MDIALLIGGVIAGIGLIVGYAFWADKKRREGLQRVAEEMGLEFFTEGSSTLQSQLTGFKLFRTGRSRKMSKLIQGASDEVQISIFDYRYTVGGGKNSHTYSQTVAALQSRELSVPDFTLRPESMLDKLGGMIRMSDIDFDSHPKFSSTYLLKGPNENAIRALFGPQLLSYFEQQSGICVEAAPGMLILFRTGRKISPAGIKEFLSKGYEVYGMLVDSTRG